MARYTEAVCRQCRREGAKLFLKGDRCYSDKCAFAVRSYAPGQHGQARKKVSEYGIQLREKQKARRIYGMLERQFHNTFVKAEKQKGITGENLLVLLERRMDNVVYRLGLADSRSQARQLVTATLSALWKTAVVKNTSKVWLKPWLPKLLLLGSFSMLKA